MIEHEVALPKGNLKRVHVDQARIKANHKDGGNLPPLTVQAKGGPYKAHEVDIDGPSSIVYDGHTLSCGAKCWIETRAAVRTFIIG